MGEKTISCAYGTYLSQVILCTCLMQRVLKLAHKGSMGNTVKIMLHTMFLTIVYLTCFFISSYLGLPHISLSDLPFISNYEIFGKTTFIDLVMECSHVVMHLSLNLEFGLLSVLF